MDLNMKENMSLNLAKNISLNNDLRALTYLRIMIQEYIQLAVGYALYNNLHLLLPIGLYLLQAFDIHYYFITGEKDEIRKIMKVLEKDVCSSMSKYVNGRTVITGYFSSWSCIGYVDNLSRYDEDCKIHLVTSSTTYKQLIEDKTVDFTPTVLSDETLVKPTDVKKIKVFIREGLFKSFYYSSIMLDMTHINPMGDQEKIMNSCIDVYKAKGRATIFIHGVSNAGKSSVGYLLAKQLDAYFCNSFNPTDPGDKFSSVLNEMKKRDYEEKPIIIVLEEVDDIIKTFHGTVVQQNRDMPILVRNKLTWTTFLDNMVFWKNVIFIMTSNTSKEEIDLLDPAYLGRGRVHASFQMMKSLDCF
jgi:hypothetical protein